MSSDRVEGIVMRVGIIGGTGPAGTALGARLSANGVEVVLGSRDEARGAEAARALVEAHSGRLEDLVGGANEQAAECEVVVLATPWDGAVASVVSLSAKLSGKVVVSMINALSRVGREFQALVPVRGSMAATVQAALPEAMVSAAFQHLPARRLGAIDQELVADVIVCADHPQAMKTTIELVESMKGLRAVEAGSLASANAVEALTAVLLNINVKYKREVALRFEGLSGEGAE